MEVLPGLLTLAGMHPLMAMLPDADTAVVSRLSATASRAEGCGQPGGDGLWLAAGRGCPPGPRGPRSVLTRQALSEGRVMVRPSRAKVPQPW